MRAQAERIHMNPKKLLLMSALLLFFPSSVHADVEQQGPLSMIAVGATASKPAARLDPPTTTTIQTGNLGNPAGWHDVAISAGWTEGEWPWVKCVIAGESNGDPNALNHNRRTGDWSFGLMQLNTLGSLWTWYKNHGFTYREELFDPYTNLHTALILRNEMLKAHLYPWGRHRCGL